MSISTLAYALDGGLPTVDFEEKCKDASTSKCSSIKEMISSSEMVVVVDGTSSLMLLDEQSPKVMKRSAPSPWLE